MAEYGLELPFLRITDRLTRLLGSTVLPANTSGSLTDARLADGAPFFYFFNTTIQLAGGYPTANISGTTITYNTYAQPIRLIYGVF